MSILFSTITFFGFIVTVAAAATWIVQRLRHRETKARAVFIAAAAVTVVALIGFGFTYEPTERAEEPPTAGSTEPAQSDAQQTTEPPAASTPPVTTPEPEDMPQSTAEPPATSALETTDPPTAPDQSAGQDDPPAQTEPPEEVDPIEQAQQDIEEATRALFSFRSPAPALADRHRQADRSRPFPGHAGPLGRPGCRPGLAPGRGYKWE